MTSKLATGEIITLQHTEGSIRRISSRKRTLKEQGTYFLHSNYETREMKKEIQTMLLYMPWGWSSSGVSCHSFTDVRRMLTICTRWGSTPVFFMRFCKAFNEYTSKIEHCSFKHLILLFNLKQHVDNLLSGPPLPYDSKATEFNPATELI